MSNDIDELTALNREEPPMFLPAALCRALEIPDASEEAVALNRIEALKADLATARNRADSPDLAKFIPRADYDAVLSRAANAEQKLADLEKAQRAQQIEAALERGLKAGQITPATVDYYRAMCQTQDGIAAFESFLAKAPPIISAASGLEGKTIDPVALNAEQQAVTAQFGHTLDDLKTFGGLSC